MEGLTSTPCPDPSRNATPVLLICPLPASPLSMQPRAVTEPPSFTWMHCEGLRTSSRLSCTVALLPSPSTLGPHRKQRTGQASGYCTGLRERWRNRCADRQTLCVCSCMLEVGICFGKAGHGQAAPRSRKKEDEKRCEHMASMKLLTWMHEEALGEVPTLSLLACTTRLPPSSTRAHTGVIVEDCMRIQEGCMSRVKRMGVLGIQSPAGADRYTDNGLVCFCWLLDLADLWQ